MLHFMSPLHCCGLTELWSGHFNYIFIFRSGETNIYIYVCVCVSDIVYNIILLDSVVEFTNTGTQLKLLHHTLEQRAWL
jgi:hypothetical protein